MNELDTLAIASLTTGDVVLDVGAGSGEFTRAALERGAKVIAVEPSAARCDQLRRANELTVVQAAAANSDGSAKYVERVRRNLATNARDAVAVPTIRLDTLAERLGLATVNVLRVRAAGNLSAVLLGASHLVTGANVIRLVGDAVLGDAATDLAGLLLHRSVSAETVAGVLTWSEEHPFVPSRIDWLVGLDDTSGAPSTEDDWAAVVQAEGRSSDTARRTRIAGLLQTNPQLYSYPYPLPHVADVLDELALDPDPATWRAAAWWRERVAGYDHRTRNARRQAAFDRRLHQLTGDREQRPSPFPTLS
jgi:FkbM family methyltransferase